MKSIEIFFKNIILKLILILNPKSKMNSFGIIGPESSILFIRLNRIGDALVTTPLFKVIKEELDCYIYVLADKKNHFVFENNPNIDEVLVFEKGLKGFRNVKSFVKSNNVTTVVDLHDDVSTTVTLLMAYLPVAQKFGLKKETEKYYSKTVKKLDPSKHHVIERVLEISKLLNIDYEKENVNIDYHLSETSLTTAKNFIDQKIHDKKYLVGVNISAGSPARFWGVDRFKKLISVFTDYNINLLILTSARDLELAEQISEGKYLIFHSPDFNEFSAMISNLDFLFTPDTSIVHIASAFQIPLFGIYVKYKTDDMIWSPYKSNFDCVITEEPNFNNLDFEDVKEKFIKFFEENYKMKLN